MANLLALFLIFFGVLTTRPLTNLQKASEKLHEHFTGIGGNSARKYHLATIEEAVFQGSYGKEAVAPKSAVVTCQGAELLKIAKYQINCGYLNLLQTPRYRSHHDDSKHFQEATSANHISLPRSSSEWIEETKCLLVTL